MNDNGQPRYAYDSEPWERPGGGASRYTYDARGGEVRGRGPSPRLVIGIVAAVVLAIAALVAALLLWLNSKQPVSPEQFTEVMEGCNLSVVEVDPGSGNETRYVQTILQTADGGITYYHMRDSETARLLFHQMQDSAMAQYDWTRYTDVNMFRHESCALTTQELYLYMAYTDDTVVFAHIEASRKDDLKAILKKLGY